MSRERTETAKYQLRSVPRQDYRWQLKGPPISREAVYAAAIRETTQEEEGVVAGMDQLLPLMAEQLRQQQEERQQEKEYRQRKEQQEEEQLWQQQEERQQEKEYRQRKEQQEEEYRRQQQEEQRRREQRGEEHRKFMHVRMLEALKMRRPTVEPHVNMAPYEESEDIKDFIEAFERVMNIQKIDQKEWVLRLTPRY